jgi:hypothetical protein
MSFWQNETPSYFVKPKFIDFTGSIMSKNRETGLKNLLFFIMQYFAVICKEVLLQIVVRLFLFSG